MRFGALLQSQEPMSLQPKIYGKVAQAAERLGYEFLCVTNHFMKPFLEVKPEFIPKHATMETWSLISYLAAKTETIRIASLVTPLPMYNPFILAKIISTIDNLSDGRVILGVGAGYGREEFEAYGSWEPAGVRVARTEEALTVMKKVWTNPIASFDGRFFKAKNVVLEPKPVQKPHPPIWTGAMSSRMFQLTAEHADVWIASWVLGATLEFYERSSRELREMALRLEREVEFGLLGSVADTSMPGQSRALATFNDCPKILEAYRGLGCEYFIALFPPPERQIELMERFQKEIVPSFT